MKIKHQCYLKNDLKIYKYSLIFKNSVYLLNKYESYKYMNKWLLEISNIYKRTISREPVI